MGGFDDHAAIMGDWMPPSPSLRSFFSSMTSDDAFVRSFADSGNESKSASAGVDKASNSNALIEPKMNSRGGLMERRASRAGFNAPRLNTESIRHADLSKEQEVRSPYLTIPPGLSPTTLLDSPVFLTNSLVQPSPTTGKFAFAQSGNNRNFTLMTGDLDKCKENTFEDTTSFAFKPIAESRSVPNFNVKNKVHASSSFPSFGVSIHSDTSFPHQSMEPPKLQTLNSHAEKNEPSSNLSPGQTYQSISIVDNSPPLDEPNEDDGDQDPNIGSGQTEDGYTWRKYGQKHVKGSEYPRSYYRCTYPNCPVKKKVERSHEGHVTEIIYKGAHTHPKPPPSRRSSNALGETLPLESEQPVWSAVQNNLEATSSARSLVEYGNGANLRAQNGSSQYESGDGVDGSCTFSNDEDDDDDDRATHGSVSLGYDGEGDESKLKRRRIETYASEMSGATRATREPRVVVQTTSEVDILDDGYRWRKYGQKVVKGNPNPRSYYKCTSAGCNVRKHVERASHDLKSVITTYEGKHNHDVPAARNSSHVNSSSSTQQAPSGAVVASHMQRAGPSQIHTSMGRYERPSSLGSFGLSGRPQQLESCFGFGLNQQRLADLGLTGLGHNQSKLPVMPVHPYLVHRPRPMNDMGFVVPKAEPKMEPATDSGFNSSDGSVVYQQLLSRLPLGPQM